MFKMNYILSFHFMNFALLLEQLAVGHLQKEHVGSLPRVTHRCCRPRPRPRVAKWVISIMFHA